LGLADHLDFIAGYDSGHGDKPEPGMILAFGRHVGVAPGEIAMVGDTLHDLRAARAAGALAVAVLTGPAAIEDLEGEADHVLDDIGGLIGMLESLAAASAIAGAAEGVVASSGR
jgi:phosphoglycolate phosphatase